MAQKTSQITIYSADWCAFCHAAKDYLDKKGIAYKDLNVDSDRKIAEEAMKIAGKMCIYTNDKVTIEEL